MSRRVTLAVLLAGMTVSAIIIIITISIVLIIKEYARNKWQKVP